MTDLGEQGAEAGRASDSPEEAEVAAPSSDLRWALVGGVIAALVAFAAIATVGQLTTGKARRLLEATLPTIRFLASGVLTASVTALALMLTMLGITYSTDFDFREQHYLRIKYISVMASVAVVMSMVLLMFLAVPLDEAESLRTLYAFVYYGVAVAAAVLGGLVVTMVLILQRAIRSLAAIGHPDAESDLISPSRTQERGRAQ